MYSIGKRRNETRFMHYSNIHYHEDNHTVTMTANFEVLIEDFKTRFDLIRAYHLRLP